MLSRSTWLHLRVPFSYFLLPIFLFAVALSPNLLESRLQWIFLILHFLLFPASNGYNSYFDRDEKSIGGLKNPPPVTRELYWMALLLDLLAVLLGAYYIGMEFAAMIFLYGLVSKAYSHPVVRLKKHPVAGWLVTGFFQGFFMFIACFIGLNKYELEMIWQLHILAPAGLTSLMLWSSYPMTQVYQHDEDKRRGDHTLSRKLGVRGTFLFAALLFTVAAAGFSWFFGRYYETRHMVAFLAALSPAVTYFGYWFWRVWKDPSHADYKHTLRLNFVSATCLSAYFIWLLFDTRNIGLYLFG